MKTKFTTQNIALLALLTLGAGSAMAASTDTGEMKKMDGMQQDGMKKMDGMQEDGMAKMDGMKDDGMQKMDGMEQDAMKKMDAMKDDAMQKMDGEMNKEHDPKKAMGS